MAKYKAVVFDLDGTLLDTLDDLADSVNYILNKYGWPERTREEVRAIVGNGLVTTIRKCAPEGKVGEKETAEFREYYARHCAVKTAPYPGVKRMLAALRERGIRIAVASNKDNGAANELVKMHFGDAADCVIGTGAGLPRKPDGAMVKAVLERLGCSEEEAVYIGDSEVDAQTAANSGLSCILVSWGFRDREMLEKLGETVDSPEELLKRLL